MMARSALTSTPWPLLSGFARALKSGPLRIIVNQDICCATVRRRAEVTQCPQLRRRGLAA